MLKSEQLLEKLYTRKTEKPQLDRMRALDKAFDYPSKSFRSIHVAGTNGKGSVCTMMARTLTANGYKTGLFTSPHIDSCHERIQIDGQMIAPEVLNNLLSTILEFSVEVTFFEVLTILAFIYFRQEKVNFAVIETGLGGEYDATNIIEPNLSVITNIAYDHTHILGGTIEEIARNKAGIIKPDTPVVVGSRAALKPMFEQAFKMKAPICIMPPVEDWIEENQKIANQALSFLFSSSFEVDSEARPMCRFDVIEKEGLTIVFDIAHNPDGLVKLFNKIENQFPNKECFVVFGMSSGKDIETAVKIIENHAFSIFPFDSEHPRLVKKSCIESILLKHHEKDFGHFINAAKKREGVLVVTGSAYIMKDVKQLLSIEI